VVVLGSMSCSRTAATVLKTIVASVSVLSIGVVTAAAKQTPVTSTARGLGIRFSVVRRWVSRMSIAVHLFVGVKHT
jgi:hypothetical protein